LIPPVYPILDTARGIDPLLVTEAWMEGGARVIQFRHKAFWSREVYGQAREVAQLCREAGAQLVVNDRADMAGLLAAGLHVGQDDLATADARKVIGPDAVLGLSTHNESQVRGAMGEPVTYVAVGPVFATGSKVNPDPVVGLEGVAQARDLGVRELVAIGGITRRTAAAVWSAGAASVAVIGDMYPEETTKAALRGRMEEWQRLRKTWTPA
jgi:thiamine-phosphate pyrophosphorylase